MKLFAVALAGLMPLVAAAPDFDPGKVLGRPSAPVTMQILSDFSCPACKSFHENTLPLLMRDFVTPGKLYIVSREYPLPIQEHKYSREAAAYATAAARIGKYYDVADALFKAQTLWGQTGKVWDTVASALSPVQQKKVQELAKEPAVLSEVQADFMFAQTSGVNETPTVILTRGSKRYPLSGYSLNYNLLKTLINDMAK